MTHFFFQFRTIAAILLIATATSLCQAQRFDLPNAKSVQPNNSPPPLQPEFGNFGQPNVNKASNLDSGFPSDLGSDLRSRFAQLNDELAKLLDQEELESEITEIESRILELKARQQLRAATRTLQTLMEKYPKSEAARRASQMLREERVNEDGGNQEGASNDGPAVRRPTEALNDSVTREEGQ